MNMTIIQYAAQRGSPWDAFKRQLSEWRRRSWSRYELQQLSDSTLRDIGLSRCELHHEVAKPFWMA